MKEVTAYEASDGQIFRTAEDCKKHQAKIDLIEKNTTYWVVNHKPDLTEGRGFYGRTYLKVRVSEYSPVQALIEDYCYRTYGRPVDFVQGVSATSNWVVSRIEKNTVKRPAKVGDYSHDYEEVDLVMGPKEKGLIQPEVAEE